ISLVRDGKVSKAETVLKQAEEKGISSVDLLLVNGELKKAKGDYEGAEQDLKQCVKKAETDEIRMRAYVLCDMAYREQYDESKEKEISGDLACLQKSRELLEEARRKVGMEDRLLIYERLAQTYIDLQELTREEEYGECAISILEEVIDRGWGTYLTYNNIAILYQKMGKFPQAREMLERMLELDVENYNTYKRFALLEAESQNSKQIAERQYGDFVQYYEKAKELYEASGSGGDVEIQFLDNLYQQLVEGGWLK
ncbi:MAG: tetratricopeptide repeat protein, partial [Lachnospiraceae bacterium]|nr:tetratricopeptide repeat protein [Lachnospiraceae bacterium]